jgi:hypothetical protein
MSNLVSTLSTPSGVKGVIFFYFILFYLKVSTTNYAQFTTTKKVLDYNKVTSKLASTDGGTSTKSFKFLSGMMTLLIPYRCAASICED